jgi:hypothetical protein
VKILLHTCCAGCTIYSFEELEKKFERVAGFFFNPNIHPYREFKDRRTALENYSSRHNKEIIFRDYEPQLFFHEINYKEQKGQRCPACWRLRLLETARFAKENTFDYFTTTLLISPYQDHVLIKTIGEHLAGELDIHFYYEDFRSGFRESQEALREEGLYSQKYCGCIYSEKERFEKIKCTR